MGILSDSPFLSLGNKGTGYQINQSLRFDGSARFSKTFGSDGNRKTFTISFWVKNTTTTIGNVFNQSRTNLRLNTTNAAFVLNAGYGSTNAFLTSNASFRDPSAWYHFVLAFDTTQSTASDRVKIWVNNQLQTYSSATYPPQNQDLDYNSTNTAYIGAENTSEYLNGYLAEYYSIDGTALTPSSFGETDTITGAWIPKKYSGSYGTNGFYLKFQSSGIGTDSSGNGNNFTATGFTTTAPGNGFYIKNMSTVSGSGSFGGGFDGDLSTSASSENFSGEVMTWTPTGGYAYTSSVEVYGGEVAYDQVRINGGSYTAMPGSAWKTIASGSGTITTIDFRDSRGNAAATFSAIRVDGVILVDYIFNSNYDVLTDTPTNNWCTLNPLNQDSAFTLSDGNLRLTSTANTSSVGVTSTSAVYSGKWYWEITRNSWNINCGISLITTSSPRSSAVTGSGGQGVSYLGTNIYKDGSSVQSGLSNMVDGDVAGIALNLDSNTVQFYRNGSALGTAVSISAGTWTPSFGMDTGGYAANVTATFNFGQRGAFAYTPPTGFKALNTANLPEPTIKKGSTYFNTVTYSGSSSNQAITVGFEPDFLWIKRRNGANDHNLYNAIVGLTGNYLVSNSTGAENSNNSRIVATSSTGFTVGTGSADTNGSGNTYVAWAWDANGAGSSNTAGTITSTVSANATAGFSIITYTGAGSAGTVGHGLGVAPKFLIVKNRSSATAYNWYVWHTGLTSASYFLNLNRTIAQTYSPDPFNATSPTSTVFSVGGENVVNSVNYVAYAFSEVASYSRISSYVGNGSSDGPFVWCGFKPAFLLRKSAISAADDWVIQDLRRPGYNETKDHLTSNQANAEVTNSTETGVDILSNGFKVRSSNYKTNSSGATYVFIALAENPFKYSTAR